MKTISRIFAKVGAGVLMAGLVLNFSACTEQAAFEPGDRKNLSTTLEKRPNRQTQWANALNIATDCQGRANALASPRPGHGKARVPQLRPRL